jgi:hypothetical protein
MEKIKVGDRVYFEPFKMPKLARTGIVIELFDINEQEQKKYWKLMSDDNQI